MNNLDYEKVKQLIEKYWPLIVGVSLFLFGVVGLVLMSR